MLVSAFLSTHPDVPVRRARVRANVRKFYRGDQELFFGESVFRESSSCPLHPGTPIQTRPATGDQVTLNQEIIHECTGCQQRRPSLELQKGHRFHTSFSAML